MKVKLFLNIIIIIFVGCGENKSIGVTQISHSVIKVKKHNQGKKCLSCHKAPANNADGEDFLSGGTIYKSLDGDSSDSYADGYMIRIILDNKLAINYKKKRGTGNSYSKDSALSSEYKFTSYVLNRDNQVVNSSKIDSHNTTTHLNCNSCHILKGKNGASGRISF